jgi:hypothetical protein
VIVAGCPVFLPCELDGCRVPGPCTRQAGDRCITCATRHRSDPAPVRRHGPAPPRRRLATTGRWRHAAARLRARTTGAALRSPQKRQVWLQGRPSLRSRSPRDLSGRMAALPSGLGVARSPRWFGRAEAGAGAERVAAEVQAALPRAARPPDPRVRVRANSPPDAWIPATSRAPFRGLLCPGGHRPPRFALCPQGPCGATDMCTRCRLQDNVQSLRMRALGRPSDRTEDYAAAWTSQTPAACCCST